MSPDTATKDVAEEQRFVQLKPKDFKGKVDPDWCPGCGDFGVLNGLQKACSELGLRPHEILTVSGIGCSSNFPGYFNAYGMHTLHGRALAVATGVKRQITSLPSLRLAAMATATVSAATISSTRRVGTST